MVMIEMREAAYDKAFGLVDEIKDLDKKKRMVLCALEDALYDCYEASKDDESEEEYESEDMTEDEMKFRNRGYRSGMRKSMLRNMYRHEDEYENEEMPMGMRSRRGMRMRRNRMNKY